MRTGKPIPNVQSTPGLACMNWCRMMLVTFCVYPELTCAVCANQQ